MTDFSSTWQLFLPQILLGAVSGGLLSLIGILLVLRKMTFFGVTLSQGVSFAVALGLFLDWKSDLLPIGFSFLLVILLLVIRQRREHQEEVVLGLFFLFFAAISQFLLALGGNVQNHLMASYFGDILTSQVKLDSIGIVVSVLSLCLYAWFFPVFLFISFDSDQYRIQRGSPFFFDMLFYGILAATVTVSVGLFGSFFSMSHMILPVFTLLPWIRNLKLLAFGVFVLSLLCTVLGFYLSLFGFHWKGEEIFFPTSSTIILILCLLSFLSLFLQFLRKKKG